LAGDVDPDFSHSMYGGGINRGLFVSSTGYLKTLTGQIT
jgi:hypothetical protein